MIERMVGSLVGRMVEWLESLVGRMVEWLDSWMVG